MGPTIIKDQFNNVERVTEGEGTWSTMIDDDNCKWYNLVPSFAKPGKTFSLIVETAKEKFTLFFDVKTSQAKLCGTTLDVWYTKKSPVINFK